MLRLIRGHANCDESCHDLGDDGSLNSERRLLSLIWDQPAGRAIVQVMRWFTDHLKEDAFWATRCPSWSGIALSMRMAGMRGMAVI